MANKEVNVNLELEIYRLANRFSRVLDALAAKEGTEDLLPLWENFSTDLEQRVRKVNSELKISRNKKSE